MITEFRKQVNTKRKSYGTIVLAKDKGKHRFSNPNTKKGRADKAKTLAKLGLSPESTWEQPKYFMVNGIPHKMDKNGNRAPLTLKKA